MANVIPVFKNSKNKDTANYKPVSITLVSRNITEKLMLGVTEKQHRHWLWPAQVHEGKELFNIITFYLWQG